MRSRGIVALPAVLLLAWLLFALSDRFTGFDVLAGLAAIAAGLLGGAAWPRMHAMARHGLELAADLLGDRPSGAGEWTPAAEGDPDRVDPEHAPTAMDAILAALADGLDADRLLVWRVDPDADRVAVEHGPGPLPPPSPAQGSPMAWALREGDSLRLDPVPRWARGAAVVTPLDDRRVLTVEAEPGTLPEPAALRRTAAVLRPFLRLHDHHADAAAAIHRLDQVIRFLRSVPGHDDPARMPDSTARAALAIAGGSGAVVASWDDDAEEGVVLSAVGADGGPSPGTAFQAPDGDLAHAARTRAPVPRSPADGRWPALATGDERWERPSPAYRAVVPLMDPRGRPAGLVAVWGPVALSVQGVDLLHAIGPLLALQLRQAGELEHYRDRATIDALTRLPNRTALDERMEEEHARFHRFRRPLAVLVVDLDRFKAINDTHGHDAGDAVLRHVAGVVGSAIREVDFAARFGGEELVVVLPETMLSAALDVADRVRTAVEAAVIEVEGTRIPVTASIGVSGCPECVDDPADLFASADQALYASKEGGRNRVTAARLRQPA